MSKTLHVHNDGNQGDAVFREILAVVMIESPGNDDQMAAKAMTIGFIPQVELFEEAIFQRWIAFVQSRIQLGFFHNRGDAQKLAEQENVKKLVKLRGVDVKEVKLPAVFKEVSGTSDQGHEGIPYFTGQRRWTSDPVIQEPVEDAFPETLFLVVDKGVVEGGGVQKKDFYIGSFIP